MIAALAALLLSAAGSECRVLSLPSPRPPEAGVIQALNNATTGDYRSSGYDDYSDYDYGYVESESEKRRRLGLSLVPWDLLHRLCRGAVARRPRPPPSPRARLVGDLLSQLLSQSKAGGLLGGVRVSAESLGDVPCRLLRRLPLLQESGGGLRFLLSLLQLFQAPQAPPDFD